MAIPVVIWVILGLVAAGAVIYINWDKIVIRWKGKRISVFGARAVGKTTLIKFLETGEISEKYSQTLLTTESSGKRYNLADLELVIRGMADHSGSKDAYGEWRKSFQKCDIGIYVFRADWISNSDQNALTRIENDFEHLMDWRDQKKGYPDQVILFGTHCDKIPALTSGNEASAQATADELRNSRILRKGQCMLGGKEKVKIVLGSLANRSNAEVLIANMLGALTE